MRTRYFLIFFLGILLVELWACANESMEPVRYFSKPSITLSLLVFLFFQKEMVPKTRTFLGLGLLFSLFGDMLLLFDTYSPFYFIGGLLSFLLAHLMYLSCFWKRALFQIKRTFFIASLLAIYALAILYFILPNVGDLLPYIIVYMTVLLLLVLVGFLRKSHTNTASYRLFLFGALFFMVSDSLLALNKFYEPFGLASVIIMFTYALAQLLIVLGGISKFKNLRF
ncbi:lysoplasmalogenase [Allomuricauda sp. SCSIO 65647]|uniref:lysoplasmalogenase n=1 Tax=Allomuricauda sp. SCSIO 65647 TaxID=2908843 RepID=UPI001F33D30F|nr:lysoplasmalogenase [Muricauda sp. SCSIO 65647]UJH66897.1 lysoplasmalogenase [Muricauda sp. SCSIO 65647]